MRTAIIILLPLVASLHWALIFLVGKRSKINGGIVLGIFMLNYFFFYLSNDLLVLNQYRYFLILMPIFILTRLSIYPLVYQYIARITLGKKFGKLDYIHFLPAVIIMLAFIIEHLMGSHAGKRYEGESRFNFVNDESRNDILYFLCRAVFILQIVFYMFRSLQLIRQYKYRINNLYSNLQELNVNWILLLYTCMLIATLIGLSIGILGIRYYFDRPVLLLINSILSATVLFLVGHLGNSQDLKHTEVFENESVSHRMRQMSTGQISGWEKSLKRFSWRRRFISIQT